MNGTPDFIVIGAGSAGCAVAAGLIENQAGSITLIEAGPSDNSPLVKTPFGLVRMIGNPKRDWCYKSAPQAQLGGRQLKVPRGLMVGGSSAINSMVWFRGRHDDFDNWEVPGWRWADVEPAFEAVEARLTPSQMQGAHPLTQALHSIFPASGTEAPTPEYESAGVFRFNMVNGRRRSAADAFLHPRHPDLTLMTGHEVDRIIFEKDAARGVVFTDGSTLRATKGVVLSTGVIGSPAILMRSGIGPTDMLTSLGIDVVQDAAEVGENLHDHPATGLHFVGPGSGYGLTLAQMPAWAIAPFQYMMTRRGRFASPTVEGGGFFNARAQDEAPDVQCHFIPFMLGWKGKRFIRGAGYFADVCVCRPKSRGRLSLASRDPKASPGIDLGLFNDPSDLDTLVAGLKRLRDLMDKADFGARRAAEAFPGPQVNTDAQLRRHFLAGAGTAYHPVGTVRMGDGSAPVSPRLQVKGVGGLWVADASVMPAVTSANTNAPSMMIGHRAGQMIAEDVA